MHNKATQGSTPGQLYRAGQGHAEQGYHNKIQTHSARYIRAGQGGTGQGRARIHGAGRVGHGGQSRASQGAGAGARAEQSRANTGRAGQSRAGQRVGSGEANEQCTTRTREEEQKALTSASITVTSNRMLLFPFNFSTAAAWSAGMLSRSWTSRMRAGKGSMLCTSSFLLSRDLHASHLVTQA